MKTAAFLLITLLCAATSRSDAASPNAAFDGTWATTWSRTEDTGTVVNSVTMTISGAHATRVVTQKGTLYSPDEDAWPHLPPEYEHVPSFRSVLRGESTAVTRTSTILQISWAPSRLTDWSPKSIPRHVMEAGIPQKPPTTFYMMQGNTLVETYTGTKWHRVSSSQRVPKHN